MIEARKTNLSPEEGKDDVIELISKKTPEQLVWAWQNLLKGLANGITEPQLKKLLLTDLKEEPPKKSNLQSIFLKKDLNSNISETEINQNINELKSYIKGDLDPNKSIILRDMVPHKKMETEPVPNLSLKEKSRLAIELGNQYIILIARVDQKIADLVMEDSPLTDNKAYQIDELRKTRDSIMKRWREVVDIDMENQEIIEERIEEKINVMKRLVERLHILDKNIDTL